LIQPLRTSGFRPRFGNSVAFLDDPFADHLDMYRLGRLWLHDRSVNLHASIRGALDADALAKTDYIFTIENRKLIRLK